MQKFASANKFIRSVVSVVSNLKVEKDDLKRLEIAFKNIDKNNDGFLSYKEIEEADNKFASFGLGDKWKDILIKCDTNRDGKISF